MFYLVRDSVIRVVSQVRVELVSGDASGEAPLARDADSVEVLGHHNDLDRVEIAKCARGHVVGLTSLETLTEFLG